MPRPVKEAFIVPVEVAYAAAASCARQGPEQNFTSFFDAHRLDDADSYSKFYTPEGVIEQLGMLPEEEEMRDYIEYLQIGNNFSDLLDAAMLDVTYSYRALEVFLHNEGLENEDPVAVLRNSKRFAHRVGVTPSAVGLVCLADINESPLRVSGWDQGKVRKVDFTDSAYKKHAMPYLSRANGCPMLARQVVRRVPASADGLSGADTTHERI